ncbi:MAG: capsule assembly Wzi family protein [Acidobacteriaceae bacterium]
MGHGPQRNPARISRSACDGYCRPAPNRRVHFAATNTDDEGRPFGQRVNLYSGISVRASAGHFAGYIRTEFQRVPFAPVPGQFAQQQIAAADFATSAAGGPISVFARGRVLDANASFAFAGNQFTVGRQTLWWGPARSGAALFSDNAEPIGMLRYDRLRPFVVPVLSRLFGSMRVQLLIGRLADQLAFLQRMQLLRQLCCEIPGTARSNSEKRQTGRAKRRFRIAIFHLPSKIERAASTFLALSNSNGCQKIGRIDDFLRN